jgi:hypothetical protein
MAKSSHELLAESLERVQASAFRGLIVSSSDLSSTDRSRLVEAGWLTEITRGYYLLNQPSGEKDQLTMVYVQGYWPFLELYLSKTEKAPYCLNPQASLDLHTGHETPPKQLIILSQGTSTRQLVLPDERRVLIYPDAKRFPAETVLQRGLRVMTLPITLARLKPADFVPERDKIVTALRMVHVQDLAQALLVERNMEAASRLIGAYDQMGWTKEAAEIRDTLGAAGFKAKAQEPFPSPPARIPYTRVVSPYAERIRVMWRGMRGAVEAEFAGFTGDPAVSETDYLRRVDEGYVNDAYHSLSIEGYQVTPDLIARIRDGKWNPDNPEDQKQIDAMAAKGYLEAFKSVKESIRALFAGKPAGVVLQEDLGRWYRALFSPSVDAGLLAPSDLAGFRRRTVIIRGSMHTPPSYEAVPDGMEAFFAAAHEEENPAVRAVLGHFIFTFIHPYVDGNGRLGRFIMNAMFASARMPWTIIRTETRGAYMAALEEASVRGDIAPFARFVRRNIG